MWQSIGAAWLLTPSVILIVAVVIFIIVVWIKLCQKEREEEQLVRYSKDSFSTSRRRQSSDFDNNDDADDNNKSGIAIALQTSLLNEAHFVLNPGYDNCGPTQDEEQKITINEITCADGNNTTKNNELFNLYKPSFYKFIQADCISLHQQIGEGYFGKVFSGYLIDMKQENSDKQQQDAAAHRGSAMLQEAEIMASFNHPNILALRGVVKNSRASNFLSYLYVYKY